MRRLQIVALFSLLLLTGTAVQAQELKVYFGLLHGHTSFSDGSGKPDDAFKMGREAGLDFMAVTEHNHKQAAGDDGVFLTPTLYQQLIQSANARTQAGQFLAIWGQEVSTISAGNHVNVFFASEICDIAAGDFKALYGTWLPGHPEVPFIQFNHPDVREDQRETTKPKERNNDYGIDDYELDFAKLVNAAGRHVALIELIVGPAFGDSLTKQHHQGTHEVDYLFYLNQGLRLGPSVGQDNHKENWGKSTHARMGVWATDLTTAAWKEAIASRRCYASEDENLEVRFTLNDRMMGSVVGLGDAETASILVSLRDPDEPSARYRVKLFYDDGMGGAEASVVEDEELAESQKEISFVHTPKPGGYYFVKITQEGTHNDDVWTAPIWIAGGPVAEPPIADDPEKTEIAWGEAKDYVGRTVTVSGRIIRSHNHQNRVLFFNYDPDFENTLSLVILAEDFGRFGGAQAIQQRLTNKQVRVRGEITLYRNERIQIRLTRPDQILSVENGN